MKKLTVVIVLVLTAIFVFTACTQAPAPAPASEAPASEAPASEAPASEAPASEAPASEAPADKKVVIGFNNGTDTLDFLKNVHDGIESEAKKAGVELLYAESNFDPEQILPNINTLLMQGADVIIDFNVNAEIGGNIVEVCKEKGVPVIGIDVEYVSAGGDKSWFMGANNQRSGELVGEAIADEVQKKFGGELEELVLFFNSENGDEVKKRVGGVVDGLKNKGITLEESQVEWIDLGGGGPDTTVSGKDKFTSWLTANPKATKVAVACVNDETSQGVLAAIETIGREKDVILGSHGVSPQYTDAVMAGIGECWIGSTAYYPERYGEYLIPLAIDLATGKNTNPDDKVTMDHVFVLRDMVPQYLKDKEAYQATWTN